MSSTTNADWEEVVGFHLRRFLAGWFDDHDIEKIWFTIGRAGLPETVVTLEVSVDASTPYEAPWQFDALCAAYRAGESETNVGTTGQLRCALPIDDGDDVMAFAILPGFGLVDAAGLATLNRIAVHAIHTARRNSVRLFFDDAHPTDLRETTYGILQRLEQWIGVSDAMVLLADTLATVTQRDEAYRVVAHETDGATLSGLVPQRGDFDWHDAFLDRQTDPRVAPLTIARWDGDRALGALVFEQPPHDPDVVAELQQEFSTYLSASPYFAMGLEKLQLLRELRERCETIAAESGTTDQLVRDALELLSESTGVPSISVGVCVDDVLRFRDAVGWTEFSEIDLPLENTGSDSGVATLAARLKHAVVLVGGEGDDGTFRNHVWVDAKHQTLDDARRPGATIDDSWTRLADFYKPARRGAYATLAYPICFATELHGVLALELDADTDWFWWNGLASHLFWESVAEHIGVGLRLMHAG